MKITGLQTFLVHPGTGKNWLFVKQRDDFADDQIDIVKKAPRSVKSNKLLKEI